MIDEGYIKYRCEWIEKDAIAPQTVTDLTRYRNALHQLQLIGEYPNGIGFGNLSQRTLLSPIPHLSTPRFIITGTQTGHLPTLAAADYALVTDFNPAQNTLTCKGLKKASSESLTHGIIYSAHPGIGAIIHVHNARLWQQLLHQVPTTSADIAYGTPEMAAETQRLFEETPLLQQKIFVMAGHEEGVVTFGETLQTAYRVLINWGMMLGIVSESALQLPHEPTS
ncbi:class II aldolase/adducin family protein [cf. Phormidesmis sp. LEGE 11477]|uniref:class II aldolase/adducin family protein n=1 Tax=cf. Phormidesmis sp. LEGE 11477 TaxID=1828680 RepID=UPI00187EB766|nr:class II aldolase/adducin family protein [cf. Phormidesmis sp. LEGE 11477]MBE9060729.1 class II aldolase/adducin family protein [cf. Phormidesmis sp. LEGE 11477]